MPELRINPDKVCQFLAAGRELAGRVPATTGDRTTTGDDSPLTFMEDFGEADPRGTEMAELVSGLNIEEQVDLLALIYLGRGDFTLDEWEAARNEAMDRIAARDADFLIGDVALPEYLGTALDAFGKSCPD